MSTDIFGDIQEELKQIRKNPFPDHVVAQSAMLSLSAAHAIELSAQLKYKSAAQSTPVLNEDVRKLLKQQLIRTAALSIHFIENL